MPYYCTVPRCTSMAGKAKNVSFHQFPRDEELAQLWNEILKRGKPYTKYSKVCSLHFKPEDYTVTSVGKNKGQWRTLRKDAIPSRNLPTDTPTGHQRTRSTNSWTSGSLPPNLLEPQDGDALLSPRFSLAVHKLRPKKLNRFKIKLKRLNRKRKVKYGKNKKAVKARLDKLKKVKSEYAEGSSDSHVQQVNCIVETKADIGPKKIDQNNCVKTGKMVKTPYLKRKTKSIKSKEIKQITLEKLQNTESENSKVNSDIDLQEVDHVAATEQVCTDLMQLEQSKYVFTTIEDINDAIAEANLNDLGITITDIITKEELIEEENNHTVNDEFSHFANHIATQLRKMPLHVAVNLKDRIEFLLFSCQENYFDLTI